MRRRLHRTFETMIDSIVGALEARGATITAACHHDWVKAGLPVYEDDGSSDFGRRSTYVDGLEEEIRSLNRMLAEAKEQYEADQERIEKLQNQLALANRDSPVPAYDGTEEAKNTAYNRALIDASTAIKLMPYGTLHDAAVTVENLRRN